jgi:flagellar hook-associated protein 2
MATSTLSSLGLGSDGVLSYDLLDQLREVDESAIITPIETKIATNETKTSDLETLMTMAESLNSSVSTLANEITYLSRSSSTSGDSVTISVEDGAAIQDFYVDVINLATRDIYQSKSFTAESSTFASTDDTLTISIDGEDYDVEITAETTLSELRDLITDATDGKVIVSLLDVGGDDPYKLIIKSAETGEDNAITFSATGSVLEELGLDENTYEAATPTGAYSGTEDDTLTFSINGSEYTINVTAGDTVEEIAEKITNDSSFDGLLSASVSEDGTLILNSSETNLSVSGDSASIFGLNSLTKQSGSVQEASNALFSYSGVRIERTTNTVDDLIAGVTIELEDTGRTNVDIEQDTVMITTTLSTFVTEYNTLIANLEETLKYDSDSGATGTFQGVSNIVSFKSTLERYVMSGDDLGRTLEDYGISFNDDDELEFDQDIFDAKIAADPTDVENFFSGYTDEDSGEEIDGYFTKLNFTLDDYIDGDDSLLGLYADLLETEADSLEEQYEDAVESLDSKYEIMATKWIAYESIISALSSEYDTFLSLVESETSSDD